MRKILFIISSDPRTSGRPAEAIRIAAGAGAWGKTEVNVCLAGPAVLMLREDGERLKDDDQFAACLPILREAAAPIYVLKTAAVSSVGDSGAEILDVKQLAQLAMRYEMVVRF